jgi:hypothetical protein
MIDVVAEDIEVEDKLSAIEKSMQEQDQKHQRLLYECSEDFDLENEILKGQLSSTFGAVSHL